MLDILIKTLWLILPAGFANSAPVLIRPYWKSLAFPLDGNKTLNKKPILGKNKTFRGLISAILMGIFIAFIQSLLYNFETFRSISIINYQANWLPLGFLLGFGMILGDAVGSFIKRRVNIKSGKPFPILDQLDGFAGALLLVLPFYSLPYDIILTALVLALVLHFSIRLISYALKITEEPW